ncbi:hypothetical protein IAT38_005445 [Cryptococcus sp. DSM 104549]
MDDTTATSSANSTRRPSKSPKNNRPSHTLAPAGSSSHPLHFFPKTYSPDSFFHSTTIAPSAHPTTRAPCVSYSRKVTMVTNTFKSGKQTVDLRPSPLMLDEGTRDPNCSQSGIAYPANEVPTDLGVQYQGIGPDEVTFIPAEGSRPFSSRAAPSDLRSDATMMSRLEGTECVGIKLSDLHQNPRTSWPYRGGGGPWDTVIERVDVVGTGTWYFAPSGNTTWKEKEEAAIRQQKEEAEALAQVQASAGGGTTGDGKSAAKAWETRRSAELDDWTKVEEPEEVVALDGWEEHL